MVLTQLDWFERCEWIYQKPTVKQLKRTSSEDASFRCHPEPVSAGHAFALRDIDGSCIVCEWLGRDWQRPPLTETRAIQDTAI